MRAKIIIAVLALLRFKSCLRLRCHDDDITIEAAGVYFLEFRCL